MTGADAVMHVVETRAGLRFPGRQEDRTLHAVRRGARREGCTLAGYADLLARDPEALGRLLSDLTVGETYFFRDSPQMQLLQDLVLAEAGLSSSGGDLALWSAGCSTGEEAYTLAMLATELGILRRVSVLGVDVSPDAIQHARAARFGPWALRGVDEGRRRAFFEEIDGRSVVRLAIRERVRFATGNLLDGPPGRFHVVVCRNVLLYLSTEARQRVAATLRDALLPDGWLITGASDPPLEISGLHRTRTSLGLVYRRGAPPAVLLPSRPVATATPRPPARSLARSTLGPVPVHEPEPQPETSSPYERLRSLADTGSPVEVERALGTALDAHPTDAALRYLAALLHLDWGSAASAAEHARAAVFLDPELAIAHLVLGHAEGRRGNPLAARRSYATTTELLAGHGTEIVWGSDGRQADELAALATQLADRMRRAG